MSRRDARWGSEIAIRGFRVLEAFSCRGPWLVSVLRITSLLPYKFAYKLRPLGSDSHHYRTRGGIQKFSC